MKRFGKVHIALIAAILVFLIFQVVQGAAGEPGSEADPIVTKGYVDTQLNILLEKVRSLQLMNIGYESKIAELEKKIDEFEPGSSSMGYEVVELSMGQLLVAKEGSLDFLIRSGKAVAISGVNGDGLADVTAGKGTAYDLKSGDIVPNNHLLIISRADGRGIQAAADGTFLLVRGAYEIHE